MLQTFLLNTHKNIRAEKLLPIIKWAGGKEAELKYVLPNLPEYFDRYFEPFVGGGAVFFAIDSKEMLINDKSSELMMLYNFIKSGDTEFFEKLIEINKYWRLLDQIVEHNSLEFIDIYNRSSSLDVSLIHVKDLVTEFVLQHNDEFNGILKTSFNLDIDNFIHEIIRN
jgi:DNA adenine methylase